MWPMLRKHKISPIATERPTPVLRPENSAAKEQLKATVRRETHRLEDLMQGMIDENREGWRRGADTDD